MQHIKTPHRAKWYEIWRYECPVCGHTEEIKEARYTVKPESRGDRLHYIQEYDYCNERESVGYEIYV